MSRVVVSFLLGEREFGSHGRFCQGSFSKIVLVCGCREIDYVDLLKVNFLNMP